MSYFGCSIGFSTGVESKRYELGYFQRIIDLGVVFLKLPLNIAMLENRNVVNPNWNFDGSGSIFFFPATVGIIL
jgi:hypothetical protein